MSHDSKLHTEKTDTYCQVNSSNLNEELGQISYVFSDKTGTLTCNEMIFKKLIVKGTPYGIKVEHQCTKDRKKYPFVDFHDPDFFANIKKPEIARYLKFLSLCHMIIIEKKDGELHYNSSSPDEVSLGNFARYCGYEYLETDELNKMRVKVNGEEQSFHLHYTLDFTSKR